MTTLGKLKDLILNVIFSRRCGICGDICPVNNPICDNCERDDIRIDGKICMRCGNPKDKCSCENIRYLYYESICAPFYYRGGARNAVFRLKFRNRRELATSLGEEMAKCVKERYKGYGFDLCTFMPAHQNKIKERGYNHAELLAEVVADRLSLPCLPLLTKDFDTSPQHQLPLYKRTGNLAGALSFNYEALSDVTDMRILLCDDVKTSGNSLNECAELLLFNGAAEVRCVTLCIGGGKNH